VSAPHSKLHIVQVLEEFLRPSIYIHRLIFFLFFFVRIRSGVSLSRFFILSWSEYYSRIREYDTSLMSWYEVGATLSLPGIKTLGMVFVN
jgi:hypothetical protein